MTATSSIITVSTEQIRNFRLASHHLDASCRADELCQAVGACGLQNSPPGAWETALYNRIPALSLTETQRPLYEEKSLLQAFSFRGAPVVFPTEESAVFLSALIAGEDEPWIYTPGIALALDFLQLPFDGLLTLLKQVIPGLDHTLIVSKSALDQTLAQWMLPLLPPGKRELWNSPSMYGDPKRQTVGGAVVSFLLRPCSFYGLLVFGKRTQKGPAFTSYKGWTGHTLPVDSGKIREAQKKLVRKFLHCYGPATVTSLADWLGCSTKQARRLWATVSEETEPVLAAGKKAWILSGDKKRLLSPAPLQKELLLLGGHDPYLDQRDRAVLQQEKTLQRQIWRTVGNPGAVVYRGEVIGIWTSRKKVSGAKAACTRSDASDACSMEITLWSHPELRPRLKELAGAYASFRGQTLLNLEF